MSAILTTNFRTHLANQFVESILEGFRTYSGVFSISSANTTATSTANVAGFLRAGDALTANGETRSVTTVTPDGLLFTVNSAFSTALISEPFLSRHVVDDNDTYYIAIGRPTKWQGDTETPETPSGVDEAKMNYWRDMVALHRVWPTDMTMVVPKNPWTSNTNYTAYAPWESTANLALSYVITSERQVFRCISNGTLGNTTSVSTSEPSITGQADTTAMTMASGNPRPYVWKYLYTVPENSPFLTNTHIPARSLHQTRGTDGDTWDDGSPAFDVYHMARSFSNGAIMTMVVTETGNNYTTAPSVEIIGDGVGAIAESVISSGQVTAVNLVSNGRDYSRATVRLSGGAGTGAEALAVISPRSAFTNTTGTFYVTNHGVSIEDELHARTVMIHAELAGRDSENLIPIDNEYRRVMLVRNPVLRGTNARATANTYRQTYDLVLQSGSQSDFFNRDEIVWQPSTNAVGVVVEQLGLTLKLSSVDGTFSTAGDTIIHGIGNGWEGYREPISGISMAAIPSSFTPEVPPSGSTAHVQSIAESDVHPQSGDILVIGNHAPVTRDENQTEHVRFLITM